MSAHFHSPLDQPIPVTFFQNYQASHKREEQYTLRALTERIRSTTAKVKDDLPWLKLAKFGDRRTDMNSLRSDENVLAISGIEADYDGEEMSFDKAQETLEQRGIAACIYTSPSHTEDAPRWRVICPLSEELPPDKRKHMLGRLNGLFGGIFSGESWTLSQSYYFGSVNRNPSHRVELIDGLPIDLHDDLDEAWIGKPQTQSTSNGASGPQSEPIDVDALFQEIREGRNYHTAMIRLAGHYAVNGKSYLEVRKILRDAMEFVFPPDRDKRWQNRYADIDRTLQYVFGKESAKPQQEEPDSGKTNGNGGTAKDGADAHSGNRQQGSDGKPEPDGLQCIALDPIGASKIQPRQWAYGHFLLFGSAAVIGAVDGGGKGAIAVAMALSMITGQPLLGERVWRTGPVAIVSYEDDRDEWHRRIAAACIHFKLDYETVLASIRFICHPDRRVCFATIADNQVVFPDSKAIISTLKSMKAVLLIVDPLNHAHGFDDGNNNVMMAKVAAEMSSIAQESGAAVLVLHHLRKGSSGQTDDLMGATSLRATFRSARILARMTPEQAQLLKITDAWRYIRIASTKENYAPPPDKATWFRLVGVPLGNVDDKTYPEGDEVGVATTWQPRPIFDGMDAPTLRQVFDALRKERHSPNRQAKNTPWAGVPLMAVASRAESEAKQIVAAWLSSGVLVKGTFRSKDRHETDCVTLDEAKVDAILAQMESPGAPGL